MGVLATPERSSPHDHPRSLVSRHVGLHRCKGNDIEELYIHIYIYRDYIWGLDRGII